MISYASFNSNLGIGSRGDEVKKVQQFLGVEPTGYFGNGTLNAVKDFQIKNNLPSTGYWGNGTRKAASSGSAITTQNNSVTTLNIISSSTSKIITTPQTSKVTSSVAGCLSLVGYSTVNGLSCSGNGTCKSGSFFSTTTSACMESLTYCQNQNGIYATYDSVKNSCGCQVGYVIDSKNTCSIPRNGYQVCGDMNGIWDGTSYTSGGGFNCTCKTGYTSSTDGKTCIVNPVKTGYQICSEAFANETWDGTFSSDNKYNCVCLSGYEADTVTGKGCKIISKQAQTPVNYYNYSGYTSSSLGKNKGEVVFSKSGCDYYIVETSLGYSLLEWYGGFLQDEGDIIYGNLNSYGMKDITSSSGRSGRVWIDDYMLSKTSAVEHYYDKCN